MTTSELYQGDTPKIDGNKGNTGLPVSHTRRRVDGAAPAAAAIVHGSSRRQRVAREPLVCSSGSQAAASITSPVYLTPTSDPPSAPAINAWRGEPASAALKASRNPARLQHARTGSR